MKSFWKPTVAAVAAFALVGSVLATKLVRADNTAAAAAVKIGATAPQFTLQDENGKTVSLSDYAGKIVVLEWTNPECPYVKAKYSSKTMSTLATQYKAQNVVWLAINSTGTATNAADMAWVKANSLSYPILNDAAGKTGHAYAATNTPQMFIIDKTGNVVYDGAIDNDPQDSKGAAKVNYVSKALDEVLAGKAVSTAETKAYGCAVHYAD